MMSPRCMGRTGISRQYSLADLGNSIQNSMEPASNTTANGLQIKGNMAHIKSGSSFDIYNARLNATALNNNVNFSLGIDDVNAKNKYFIAALVTQPTSGTYAIQLKPDSLMLNYQRWSITSNNLITISPDNIVANNFV